MNHSKIYKSLYKNVTWMGMERIPSIIWVLSILFFFTMAMIYAKVFILACIFIIIGGLGIMILKRIAEADSAFFKIINNRRKYQDNYTSYQFKKGK